MQNVTKSAADIMQAKIDSGMASAVRLFDEIETKAPTDAIVKASAIRFEAMPAVGVGMMFQGHEGAGIHKHALGQIASRAGIPTAYLAELVRGQNEWQRELAAHMMREHFGHDRSKYLVRSVQGEVRGFLSDRYRRIDSRPLLHAFAEECHKVGAVPVDGGITDTRVSVKAILPRVFEPVPGEALCLGIEWGNSDFGAAAHTIRPFILRLWCLNGATMENSMSQVHLGRQMNEDIELSQRTYAYDTKASISALRDIVGGVLSAKKVDNLMDAIRTAEEAKVDWKTAKNLLSKRLLKGELKSAEESFTGPDVVNLPPGNTMWRASNAVSWLAKNTEDPNRKLELERVAGELVNGKVDRAEAA